MPEDDKPRRRGTREGIPLEQLSPAERERLRREALERAATPHPVTVGDETAQIGRAMFERGGTSDVDRLVAAFADRIASRVQRETLAPVATAVSQAEQAGRATAKAETKRSELHDWLRFALGCAALLGVLLAAWQGMSDKIAARPTDAEVGELLAPLRASAKELDAEQRAQRDLVIEIRGSIKAIESKVGELTPATTTKRKR